MPFSTTGENLPVTAGGLRQSVEIVARFSFHTARQMRCRDLAREPSVPLLPTREHEQMRAVRIQFTCPGSGRSQRQLSAEHGLDAERFGCFGKPDNSVEAVVVGDRNRFQAQTHSLFDHCFRMTGTVEKTEGRMRM